MNKFAPRLAIASLLVGGALAPMSAGTSEAATPVKYKNCTALVKKYPKGVKKSAATNNKVTSKGKVSYKTSTATVNATAYKANTHLDADKDGIACER